MVLFADEAPVVVAVLNFLGSLVWPLVFVWVVVRFRAQFEQLLNRIVSADVAGNKFVFQQPSAEATATPDARVEINQIDPQGFFTSKGIQEIVTQSGLLPPGEEALDQLLLFDNGRQHTWLVASPTKLAFVLDDEGTRASNRLVQQVIDIDGALPLEFATKGDGSPAVKFGRGPGPSWYYSSSLFPSSQDLRTAVTEIVRRAKAK